MNADRLARIPEVFGKLLARLRAERDWTQQSFAAATGLPDADDVGEMERGRREPTLTEFFKIAEALGAPPGILFIDLIAASRADPVDDFLNPSRRSQFARLYRLGWSDRRDEFRELYGAYETFDSAAAAAEKINTGRHKRGLKPIDTICSYVRMGFLCFSWMPKEPK